MTWNIWANLTVAILMAAFWSGLAFRLLFPWLLTRPNPAWPLTALGRCAALAWMLSCATASVLVWRESATVGWVLVILALSGTAFLLYYWRSPYERTNPRA